MVVKINFDKDQCKMDAIHFFNGLLSEQIIFKPFNMGEGPRGGVYIIPYKLYI